MTVGERIVLLALSVSSAALIGDSQLMKSPQRSIDMEGQMSWWRKNLFSATAQPAESKQL